MTFLKVKINQVIQNFFFLTVEKNYQLLQFDTCIIYFNQTRCKYIKLINKPRSNAMLYANQTYYFCLMQPKSFNSYNKKPKLSANKSHKTIRLVLQGLLALAFPRAPNSLVVVKSLCSYTIYLEFGKTQYMWKGL